MYQTITDFRGGLDTRKMSLALPAGTLIQATNCHINQGAEIEKRKAFVQTAIGYGSTYPTFGVCAGVSQIYVFGSGSLAAGVPPTASTPAANWPPAPLAYQMLTHPAVLALTAYAQGTHNLIAIVDSELFGDFPFAIAQFADGGVYCYYNGTLVPDFVAGVVLAYMAGSGSKLATALQSLVGLTSNYTAFANGSNLDIYSLPGATFSAALAVQSGSNFTVATLASTNYSTATVVNDTGNNPADGSTVSIGEQIYRFKITMLAAFDVQIGATALATAENLFLAIGATVGSGTNYYASTTANANVAASNFIQTPNPTFTITAKVLLASSVVENNIAGVNMEEIVETSFSTVYGTPSTGQFAINAGSASVYASGTLTTNGTSPTANSTVTIGGITYKFVTSLNNTYDILRASTAAATIVNLENGINYNGGGGYYMYGGGSANPSVTASVNGNVLTLAAVVPGTSGNTVGISQSGVTNLTASGSTLANGGANNGITNIYVGPIAAIGTITPNGSLPANNSTLAIGAYTYTFVTVLPGTPAEGSLLIGATTGDTMQTLINAINGTGTYGVDNQVSSEHQQVFAVPTAQNGAAVIIARAPGSGGNVISMVVAGGANLTLSGATLANGAGTANSPTAGQPLLASPVLYGNGQTLLQFSQSVAVAINAYTATSGFTAKAKNQTVVINSSKYASVANGAAIAVVSSGQICVDSGGFSFVQQTTVQGSVSSITVNATEVIGTTISQSTTVAALVIALAAKINGNTTPTTVPNGSGGYLNVNQYVTAVASGNILYLSLLTVTSLDAPVPLTCTTDGVNIIANQLGVGALTASIPAILAIPINSENFGQGQAACTVSGGYPPYSFNWYIGTTTDPTLHLQIVTNDAAVATFQIKKSSPNPLGVIYCAVTDSLGNSVTSSQMDVSYFGYPYYP